MEKLYRYMYIYWGVLVEMSYFSLEDPLNIFSIRNNTINFSHLLRTLAIYIQDF